MLLLAALFGTGVAGAVEGPLLEADFSRAIGAFRPLHGTNKGPVVAGGLLDLSAPLRALGVPLVRLHDCHWPTPDVVDMHVLFPNPDADPQQAQSYDFTFTDQYLAAVRATGAQVVFRLGESIEHTSPKRHVHPPKEPAKWAAAAVGILRHYNEGWANGFRYGIRYWEIWNEPENRPNCWTGSDADYFELYRVAARALKAHDPELKVGGPSVGYTGQLAGGEFRASEFVTSFVEMCGRKDAPLDFFSWHCYTADPAELAARAKGIRRLLDAHGLARTESHLNEWNYLPGGNWDGFDRGTPAAVRQAYFDEMGGPRGAAFAAAALLSLQDAPVDAANFFHGEVGPMGLFTDNGVPLKVYYGLQAFHLLLDTPQRVPIQGAVGGQLAAGAGLSTDGHHAGILISNFAHPQARIRLLPAHLPWAGATLCDVRVVDDTHALTPVREGAPLAADGTLSLDLKAPAVAFISLRPAP